MTGGREVDSTEPIPLAAIGSEEQARTTRAAATGALLLVAALAGVAAAGQEPPAAAKPRTYALVAAFPDRYTVIFETTTRDRVSSTRVDRYRRSALEAAPGTFNRVALAGLQAAIAAGDPAAQFVFLAQPGATPARVAPQDREEFLLHRVSADIESMPQRREWHRVVVALPAYRALDLDGMPTRLEGFGLFLQPNCQSDPLSCALALRPPGGPPTLGPDGQEVRASYFVAPYSSVAIVILDPATLAVLDRESDLDFQRYYDSQAGTLDLGQVIPKEVLAPKVVGLIDRSLAGAIARTGLAGKVEIGDVKEVKP